MDNPFVDCFVKVHQAVQAQQGFETPMIKALINSRMRSHDLPGAGDAAMEDVIVKASRMTPISSSPRQRRSRR